MTFRPPAHGSPAARAAAVFNVLVFRVQPDDGIELHIGAKRPGGGMHIQPVSLGMDFRSVFDPAPEAYERLICDVLRGDATLFPRREEVEGWSASSSTIRGPLPPSSICEPCTCVAACLMRIEPTRVEPVKLTFLRRGSAISAADMSASRVVGRNPITPAGTPAATKQRTSTAEVSGVNAAGLTSAVQPAASAAASFRAATSSGKFHGEISKQGPTGR